MSPLFVVRAVRLLLDVEPAAVEMHPVADAVLERRMLRAAVESVRAARPELAALGRVEQRRGHPVDLREPDACAGRSSRITEPRRPQV